MSEAARQDLAHVQEHHTPANAPVSLMDALIRAASDPNVDVDKLERLGALVQRIDAQRAEADFHDAMNAAQDEMRPIATDSYNPQTKSRYASYGQLDKAIRPIYTRHGFSLSYDTEDSPKADHIRILCRVARSGHTELHHIDMPADGKGAKGGDVMTKTHATGAAVTYGKRYLLGMIFNIAVGEDTDGNAPSNPKQIGEAARRAIEEINACEGAPALATWKREKSQGLSNLLPADEMREVIATYNRRVEAVKAAQQ